MQRRTVHPADVGMSVAPLAELLVESAQQSAAVIEGILQGERSPRRDHALLNAGAALVVYGVTSDLGAAIELAGRAIDEGEAQGKLERLIETSCA